MGFQGSSGILWEWCLFEPKNFLDAARATSSPSLQHLNLLPNHPSQRMSCEPPAHRYRSPYTWPRDTLGNLHPPESPLKLGKRWLTTKFRGGLFSDKAIWRVKVTPHNAWLWSVARSCFCEPCHLQLSPIWWKQLWKKMVEPTTWSGHMLSAVAPYPWLVFFLRLLLVHT